MANTKHASRTILIDPIVASALTAMYGAGWAKMTKTALEAAITSIKNAPRATYTRRVVTPAPAQNHWDGNTLPGDIGTMGHSKGGF